jgi:hypothetical protein
VEIINGEFSLGVAVSIFDRNNKWVETTRFD